MISSLIRNLQERIFQREKIYIFPNGFGFLYLGVIIVMILVGATYSNNLIFLLGFFLFSVFVSSMVQTHNNIKDVEVTVIDVEDTFEGSKAKVTIAIKNHSKRSKQSLRVIPRKKDLRPEVPGKIDLVYGLETFRSYFYLEGKKRGRYRLKDLTVYTVYPMGLFYSWKYSKVDFEYFVYPKALNFEKRPTVKPVEEVMKNAKARTELEHRDDFKDHRAHQQGESHHHIDWKVYAKSKEKMVKTFESPAGAVESFDLARTRPLTEEEGLSQISYWIQQASFRNKLFEVVLGPLSVGVGQGHLHAKKCQRSLALYGEEVSDAS